MLEGLEKIDWKNLQHAYGAAADVPRNIRGLLSSRPAVREKSLSNLEFSIFHQGSVYEATVPAVRFLVELAESPSVQDRERILYLLADIATGNGWFTNHESLSIIRQTYSTETIDSSQEAEARFVTKLHEEFTQYAERLTDLISVENKDVRLAATRLISLLPDSGDMVCRAFVSRFPVETDDKIRANILRCLVCLDREKACRVAEDVIDEGSTSLTRLIALAVIVATGGNSDTSKAIPELTHSVLSANAKLIKSYNSLPSVNEFFSDLAVPLAMKNKEFAEQAAEMILKQQQESAYPDYVSSSQGTALLFCALYPEGNRVELNNLEPWQKTAVWQVARSAWPESNVNRCESIDVLAQFGLPTSYEGLASAIGYSTDRLSWKRKIDRTCRNNWGKASPWWKFW